MATTSQKHAELKRLGKQAAKTIYDMLRLTDEIISDHEYVDKFGGEGALLDALEADEYIHFGGDPSLTAMLRAYRANSKRETWEEYRYNIRAMIELAHEQEDRPKREARKAAQAETLQAIAVVVADAARKHSGNVDKAVAQAEKQAKGIKGFRDVVPELLRHALQERVYDVRHGDNLQQRKTKFADSSPYGYCLGGTVLGRLNGDQLVKLAADESEAAAGHEYNARVCRDLAKLVEAGQTVKQAVSEDKLQEIMDETTASG